MNERRKILFGIGATSAMAAWHKPLINAVVVPAHAQGSPPIVPETPPPPPPVVCPDLIIDNVTSQALSGANSSTSCGVTFDVLSSSPDVVLTVTAIDTSALAAGVTVVNDGLGAASMTSGPRVTWTGPIAGTAPGDCTNPTSIVPAEDVTFTITATCPDGDAPTELVITLTGVLALAV